MTYIIDYVLAARAINGEIGVWIVFMQIHAVHCGDVTPY